MSTTLIDENKLEAFLERIVDEIGAALNVPLTVIGQQLGLYRAMADGQPVSPDELAARTGTQERYVREWLAMQAAGGYVIYDPDAGTFRLPAEHAAVLADPESPVYQGGMFQSTSAAVRAQERVLEHFRAGGGLGYEHYHDDLFEGIGHLFGVTYRASLVQEWIPALDGVEEKLERGARVADVGCGVGIATVLLAEAYPASTFHGFDIHADSLEAARERAREAGVDDRLTFELASATGFDGSGYDLIACFDALHDMGDPAAAAAHIRSALAPDGTWLIVEPNAGDRLEENLHPLGRVQYGYSTLVCTPSSLAQPGAVALGTAAGPAALGEAIRAGGFTRVERRAETLFNMVLEARP